MTHEQLTALFRKLGASDPEDWATSQIEEGIPQLARYLFLRQAWRQIVKEGDATWIDNLIAAAQRRPNDPYAGVGHALAKLRARGATDEELTDVVRGTQAEALAGFCYLLEDPGELEPEVADTAWALVRLDAKGEPIESIPSLHESVLELDPTGRSMRPRGAKA
jgi:hypothetical protein